jgi:hypothetical protein
MKTTNLISYTLYTASPASEVLTRVVDPDSVTLWIRIRIGNPDPGSGSRGKKIKNFSGKMHILVIF